MTTGYLEKVFMRETLAPLIKPGMDVYDKLKHDIFEIRDSSLKTRKNPTDLLIEKNPDILGGAAVFAGTRVPVRILIEYWEAGDRLDEFLDNFPTVSRSQAVGVLELTRTMLTGISDESVT